MASEVRSSTDYLHIQMTGRNELGSGARAKIISKAEKKPSLYVYCVSKRERDFLLFSWSQ